MSPSKPLLTLTGDVPLVSVFASMRKILPVLTIAALSLSALGCSDKAPAVASLEVTPRTLKLGYPEMRMLHPGTDACCLLICHG